MAVTMDLENHVSITSAAVIDQIIAPLREHLGIKFFRYLKLYQDGKRILLSNVPDAVRYMYGQGNYFNLWYDGEFPDFATEGWHVWQVNRLLDTRDIEEKIENDLISLLGVNHGMTYIHKENHYYEAFSFDSFEKGIYKEDKQLLLRFTYYFREQAKKLIEKGQGDCIIIPIKNKIVFPEDKKKLIDFLSQTKINRYYLGGELGNTYLTSKESVCARWLVEGKSVKEIARLESIEPKTVDRHIENVKRKLNCQKQTQIIRTLLRSGLLMTKL